MLISAYNLYSNIRRCTIHTLPSTPTHTVLVHTFHSGHLPRQGVVLPSFQAARLPLPLLWAAIDPHTLCPHFHAQVFSLIKAWCFRPKPSLPSAEGDDDDAVPSSRPWGEYAQGEEESLDETQRAQLRAAKKAQAVS